MLKRPLRLAILALGGFAAASSALSLGFGRIPDSVPFGQPFDLAVPVRLEPGESLAPGCQSAELRFGDQHVAAASVHVQIERGGEASAETRVRIRSPVVVQEPVVAVNQGRTRGDGLFLLKVPADVGATLSAVVSLLG